MGSIEQYLSELGAPGVDISSKDFGPFYHHKVKPKLATDLKNEAALFFDMIISASDMHMLDALFVGRVYEASNAIHKKQLASLMMQNGLEAIKRMPYITDYQEITTFWTTAINYATRLLKTDSLNFSQYLHITVNILKLQSNPKDVAALSQLKDLVSTLPETGVIGTLTAYLSIAVGTVLNTFGVGYGQEMIDDANAKLKINSSLRSALQSVSIFAKTTPADNFNRVKAIFADEFDADNYLSQK